MRSDAMTRRLIQRVRGALFDRFGIEVGIRPVRPEWSGDKGRFAYQQKHIEFDIRPGERVLDVGNGGDPFPYATVLVDRFLEMSATRHQPLDTQNKPFALADVHHLPFRDKSFDYVCCAHVLELVENPLQACKELIRVGRRGFIETPTAGKDMLFAWARGEQKWHVVSIGQTLCFFEYSDRQLDGIRSTTWRDLIFSNRYNPLQELFYNNQDVFNVMFTWQDRFCVYVFRLDGTFETLNAGGDRMLPELATAGDTPGRSR